MPLIAPCYVLLDTVFSSELQHIEWTQDHELYMLFE